MVSTKHCCWGECKTDSRYPDKWPKSLKEMEKSAKKVFIPFPKPSQGIKKCKRWIVSCSRQFFTEKSITRNTYICALHWPGEKGPTVEFPDPLKANFTPAQAHRVSSKKRKAPTSRATPAPKIAEIVDDLEEFGEQSNESFQSFDELEDISTETAALPVQSNLDYPDLDYPDFSIIRTFSLVPFFSRILISFDLKSFQR